MLKSLSVNARIFLVVAVGFGVFAIAASADFQAPNVHQGYAPEQPIAYSHRTHAGELGIDCLYCHYGARTSPVAGIPATGLCMNCHATVTAGLDAVVAEREQAEAESRPAATILSPEIAKLWAAQGLDVNGQPAGEPHPIPWVRVHNLPDFVAFDHSVHVNRGLACATCHGPVQTMERVRQESDLSMGWCLDCHRGKAADPTLVLNAEHGRLPAGEHVSTDCSACHY